MATYFHGSSEIQAGGGDGLQTLILMNPTTTGYVGFSDRQQPSPPHPPVPGCNNLLFFNSSSNTTPGGNSLNLIHAPPSQQLVGIPLTSAGQDNQQDVSSFHAFLPQPQVQYNPYCQNFDLPVARDIPRSLSLRLSSQQQQQQQPPYGSFRHDHEFLSQPIGDDLRVSVAGASSSVTSRTSDDVNGMQGVILNSKFLRATQELLDEVVNVNKGLKNNADSGKGVVGFGKNSRDSTSEIAAAASEGQSKSENGGKLDNELTTTERQEIQMKKAKLLHMIDEVEQRYRQYHHQMQVVISWFEQSAGIGSAKTYTSLALKTISRQFRCLKDAILSQVKAASKRLGEDQDSLISGKNEGSKLKYIDNQLRQQRALQQLGMVQHNAWRPQRGLPERSVSVLRAWLFEHFLHPYPKESDKFMLAKQTGLTRSQVSNWFINARVRLWKPMVEEMYTEEMKEQEKKGHVDEESASPEKASSFENQIKDDISNDENALNPNNGSQILSTSPGFNLIDSDEMEKLTQGSPKKPRNTVMLHSPGSVPVPSMNIDENQTDLNNESLSMNFGTEEGQNRQGFSFVEGFGSYPIAELERFSSDQFQETPYSANGFSLTLGLPQWGNLTMHGPHQPFLPNQNIQMNRDFEVGESINYGNKATPSSSNQGTNVYENINIQDRKRLAAQFFPDFVA